MNKRKYIRGTMRRNDFLRVLLTDTSPYELPIIISNDGFYKNLYTHAQSSPTLQEFIKKFIFEGEPHYTIPLRFNISKEFNSRRQLSLLHPQAQYKTAMLYQKYDTLIACYCGVSSSSIRQPAKIGSTFFFRSEIGENNKYKNNKIDTTDIDLFVKNPASYFSYHGVDRLYKFYGSVEFMRLEKKYSFMRLTDISKCFSSIYTHSVSWAIKSAQHSKDNNAASAFGNDFDKLMQKMNFNETNGICIGPEVSRIFAEIILSAVDAQVEMQARERSLILGRDFEYKRYVDDFILFANSPSTLKGVMDLIEDQLLRYNLHLNEAKTLDYERPFLTPKSHMIENAKGRLSRFFEGVVEAPRLGVLVPRKIHRPTAVTRSLISSIKSGCFEEDVGYDMVANYVVASLVKRIEALISGFDLATIELGIDSDLYGPLLMRLMEAVFYFYTVHPTVASSFNVGRAIIVLWRFFKEELPGETLSAGGQFQRWVNQLVRQHGFQDRLSNHEKVPVEFLNVILAAGEVSGSDEFDEDILRETIFNSKRQDYFSLVSCLFYVKAKPTYAQIRGEIEASILGILNDCRSVRKSAHDAHLALDAICCPYLSLQSRTRVLRDFRTAIGLAQRTQAELEADVAEMESKPWFVQWEKLDILRMVKKKELSAVY
ncbi:antiviral reverse transcriptase Drt3b [Rhizobium brockwellii]